MPDHFHAVIVPRSGDTISAVMRYVKGAFARWYNASCGSQGAVWQPRFYDVAIRSEQELSQRIAYVEENPVQARMVDSPSEYPYSSAFPGWRSDLEGYMGGPHRSG
jgi:putative transposase